MKIPTFLSPYIKVDCPDGPRFILRRPERAFFIIASDWDVRIKAIAKALESIEPSLEIDKKFTSIAENLGKNFSGLQAHYQAAYLNFATNPCAKEAADFLENANEEIRRKEYNLREIEIKTEKALKLAREKRKNIEEDLGFPLGIDEVSLILKDIKRLVSGFKHLDRQKKEVT